MNHSKDRLFQQVAQEVSADLSPVARLRPAWQRSLVMAPWLLLCVVVVVGFTGMREVDSLHPIALEWASAGLATLAALLFWACLRGAVPGGTLRPVHVCVILGFAAALRLGLAASVHEAHAHADPKHSDWQLTAFCGGVVFTMAAPLVLIGVVLVRRGFVTRLRSTSCLMAASATLAAEAVWRLHCPVTGLWHTAVAHYWPIAVFAAVSMVVLREASPRQR